MIEFDPNSVYVVSGHGLPNYMCSSIVKRLHRNAHQIMTNYGYRFPVSKVPFGSTVYIVNFNYDINVMEELSKSYHLIWITNNPAVIEGAGQAGFNPPGLRREDISSCEATWRYCFPDLPLPLSVKLVSDWDMWKFLHKDTGSFHQGCNLLSLYPSDKSITTWNRILNDDDELVPDIISKGAVIEEYTTARDIELLKDLAFTANIAGLKCLCVNTRGINSLFFDSVTNKDQYDAFISFGWIPSLNKYRVTAWATNDTGDISPLLLHHNGGGKPGVGGWMDERPILGNITKDNAPEVVFDDHMNELYATYIRNNTVRAFNAKHERINVKSQMHKGYWHGYNCAFTNSAFTWPDIWFNVDTTDCSLAIAYVYTNTGKWRLIITNLTNVDLGRVANLVGGKIVNNEVWAYIDAEDVPGLPIFNEGYDTTH